MTKETIICTNRYKKKGYKLISREDYEMCSPCRFLWTHMGQQWMDDKIECRCPRNIEYRDKIEYRPASYKLIKYQKKKKPKVKKKCP